MILAQEGPYRNLMRCSHKNTDLKALSFKTLIFCLLETYKLIEYNF